MPRTPPTESAVAVMAMSETVMLASEVLIVLAAVIAKARLAFGLLEKPVTESPDIA